MRVLVACEFSGVVRDAFIAHGHDAMSCDLLPTEAPGPHFQGDVREVLAPAFTTLHGAWDLMIAHPPCTYLANSGVRWLHERPDRWPLMLDGAVFLRELLNAPVPRVAVENPVMHRYAKQVIGRGPDQIIQPWQFGHGETKATCLWLRGLPLLAPTQIVDGREGRVWKESPSEDRWKKRSITYPGIADAMAAQWGGTED